MQFIVKKLKDKIGGYSFHVKGAMYVQKNGKPYPFYELYGKTSVTALDTLAGKKDCSFAELAGASAPFVESNELVHTLYEYAASSELAAKAKYMREQAGNAVLAQNVAQ